MAINLVSLVQQYLTPQLVGSLARSVGVNEAVAQKLVAAALPAILAALATAAAAPGGAQKVSDAISNSDPDLLTKLSGAMTGGNTRFVNDGANLLSGLLGTLRPLDSHLLGLDPQHIGDRDAEGVCLQRIEQADIRRCVADGDLDACGRRSPVRVGYL